MGWLAGRVVPPLLLSAACLSAATDSGRCTSVDPESLIAIRGATLIDGRGGPPLRDALIVIEGDRIRAVGSQRTVVIPPRARILEMRGKYVLPGLIDCHVHLESIGLGDLVDLPSDWREPEKARELTRVNARLDLFGGVTTVRDLGSTNLLFQVRQEIDSGRTPGPRILAAGHQLVTKTAGAYMDPMFAEYDSPNGARARVREQVALGADVIKIRLTPDRPLPSPEEMRAMVSEAHALGRRVAVHTWVPADEAVRLAVDAGVNTIEHNAPLRAKDANILPEMGRRQIGLMAGGGGFYVQRWEPWTTEEFPDSAVRLHFPSQIVTLFSDAAESLRAQTARMKEQGWNPAQVQARFIGETQRARQAGVLLVFGTDAGGSLMLHGQQYQALYGESQMGSTPMQAILMATRDAARALGIEHELGTVQPGKLADLLIVDADPLADLRNLGKVRAVFKGGRLVAPASP